MQVNMFSELPMIWDIKVTCLNPDREEGERPVMAYSLGKSKPQSADSPLAVVMRVNGGHMFTIDLPHSKDEARVVIEDADAGIRIFNEVAYMWFATSALKRDTLTLTSVKLKGWFDDPNDFIRLGTMASPCHFGVKWTKARILVVGDDYYGCGDGQSTSHMFMGKEVPQYRMMISYEDGIHPEKLAASKGLIAPGAMVMPVEPGMEHLGPLPQVGGENSDFVLSVGSIKPAGRFNVGDMFDANVIIGVIGQGQGREGRMNAQYVIYRGHNEAIQRELMAIRPTLVAMNREMVSSVQLLARKHSGKAMRNPLDPEKTIGVGILGAAYDLCEKMGDYRLLYSSFFLNLMRGEVNSWNRAATINGGITPKRLRALCVKAAEYDGNGVCVSPGISKGVIVVNAKTARDEFGILNAADGSYAPAYALRSPHVKPSDVFAGYVLFLDSFPELSIGIRWDDAACMGCDFDGDDLDVFFPWSEISRPLGMAIWSYYRGEMVTTISKGRAESRKVTSNVEAALAIQTGKVGLPAMTEVWLEVATRMSDEMRDKAIEWLASANGPDRKLATWKTDVFEPYVADVGNFRSKLGKNGMLFPPSWTQRFDERMRTEIARQIANGVDSAKKMSAVDTALVRWGMRFYKQLLKINGFSDPLGFYELFNTDVWLPDRSGKGYMGGKGIVAGIKERCVSPHPLAEAWANLGTKLLPLGGDPREAALEISAKSIQSWMPEGSGYWAEKIGEIYEANQDAMRRIQAKVKLALDAVDMVKNPLPGYKLAGEMMEFLGMTDSMVDEGIKPDVSWVSSYLENMDEQRGEVIEETVKSILVVFQYLKDDVASTREAIHRLWNVCHGEERAKGTIMWTSVPEIVFDELYRLLETPATDFRMVSGGSTPGQKFQVFVGKGTPEKPVALPSLGKKVAKVSIVADSSGRKQSVRLSRMVNGNEVFVTVRENTPLTNIKSGDEVVFEIVSRIGETGGFNCVVLEKQTVAGATVLKKVATDGILMDWTELSYIYDDPIVEIENLAFRSTVVADLAPARAKAAKKAAAEAAKRAEEAAEEMVEESGDPSDTVFDGEVPEMTNIPEDMM